MSFAAFALAAAVAATPTSTPVPAPTPTPSIVTNPDWRRIPSGEDMADAYPEGAWVAGVEGKAVLRCRVAVSGFLRDCWVESEAPVGQGFGEAALTLSKQFEVAPKARDGKPVDGAEVRIPLVFKMPEPTLPTADQLQDMIACYGVISAAYEADSSRHELAEVLARGKRSIHFAGGNLGMRREDVEGLLKRSEEKPATDKALIDACWKGVEFFQKQRAARALR